MPQQPQASIECSHDVSGGCTNIFHIRMDLQDGQLRSRDSRCASYEQVGVGLVYPDSVYTSCVEHNRLRESTAARISALAGLDHVRSVTPRPSAPTLLPLLCHASTTWPVEPEVIIGTRTKLNDRPLRLPPSASTAPIIPTPVTVRLLLLVLPITPGLLLASLIHRASVECVWHRAAIRLRRRIRALPKKRTCVRHPVGCMGFVPR